MSYFQATTSEANFTAADLNREYIHTVLPLSVLFGILFLIGVVGNGFIVYVYIVKYPQCNFRYFVIILGIIDLLRCFMTVPAEIYTQYTWFIKPISEICKAKIFFNTISITSSSVILLLIAVDRYRKACCPHGWQIQPICALKLCVVLSIVSVLWSGPSLVVCGPQTYVMKYAGSEVNVTVCLKDDAFKNTIWPFLILKVVYAVPTSIIMVVTLILYILIARRIYKRTRNPKKKAGQVEIRTETGSNADRNTADLSVTADEPSYCIDSEYTATLQRTSQKPRTEQAKSGELNIDDIKRGEIKSGDFNSANISITGAFHIKVGTDSNAFLFNIPMVDLKSGQACPAESSTPVTCKKPHKRPFSHMYSRASRRRQRARMRRNTLIMFILTLFFVITITTYFVLAFQMSDTGKFFNKLTLWQGILVMFFLRLYYFNSLINAILYGLLDPRFRRALRRASRRMSKSVASIASLKSTNRITR